MTSLKAIKHSLNNHRVSLSLLTILILALGLRVHTVLNTEVIAPFRSDAGEYFFYAYNLKHHGTFSKSPHGYSQNKAPKPDAYRTPGYPLFLALFVDGKVTAKMLTHILIAQAFLSTLVVYFTYLLSRKIFPVSQALVISLLTAISPHLININIYILSEALFSFLVILFFWSLSRVKEPFNPKTFLMFGVLLGLASLVRPAIQYFVVLMIIVSFLSCGFRKGGQLAAVLLAGYFLVFGPWMARNLTTLGILSDNYVKYATIKFGLYPGLMYKDDPKTLGYPYHFDPNASQIKPELSSILKEVKRRFTTEPVRHLKWYGYEKGIMLWSWNMVVGEGEHWGLSGILLSLSGQFSIYCNITVDENSSLASGPVGSGRNLYDLDPSIYTGIRP